MASSVWACSSTPAAPLTGDDSGPPAATDASPGETDATADADGGVADGGPSADGADSAPPTGPTLQALTVSTGTLVPAFDPAVTDYGVTSLNCIYPIDVTATAADSSSKLTVHGAAAQSGVASTFTLKPYEDFSVVVTSAGGASTTYTVHYVPADMPAYTVFNAPGAGTEDLLLTPNDAYVALIDRAGAPLYYRTFPPDSVANFQRHALPGGGAAYSMEHCAFNSNGWCLGVAHVMDAQFRDVGDVQLLPNRAHGALPADSHDFMMLDSDHYVVETYVQRTVDLSGLNSTWSTQAQVENNIVQEIDHGSVVFEWDSGDVPSLYTDSVDHNAFSTTMLQDYLHLNSLDIDPADGNFIFSLRHTNSIVKVDRHTAKILWTLGGAEDQFGLTPDQVFSHQHYVRVQPDGSLWIFDNGNNLHQTRIISFSLDEQNKKVTSFQVIYEKPATEPQTAYMGSHAQLGGGRDLFGWGGWLTTDIEPAVTEIVGGSVVWSLTFTAPSVFSYRALPITTL